MKSAIKRYVKILKKVDSEFMPEKSFEDFINELGNEILVYKTKKYGIPCKRQFEINATGVIVGFTSSGCI